MAYVIGYVNFLHCKIWLDSKPLIPRAETEFWVEQVIKKMTSSSSPVQPKILDLCAGSGCIGIALAKALTNSQVDFVELDSVHIPTIEKNCRENNLSEEQIQIILGNLFTNVTDRYDVIISNPPYIDQELKRTDTSVTRFEPPLALYGGKAGLDIIAKIIDGAQNHLKANGELWLEHEPEQTQNILALAEAAYTVITKPDQYGVERFSQLVLK